MSVLPREQGQGLVEYGLILLFIALAVFATVAVLGVNVTQIYEQLANAI